MNDSITGVVHVDCGDASPEKIVVCQDLYETDSEEISAKEGILKVSHELKAQTVRWVGELSVEVSTEGMERQKRPMKGTNFYEVHWRAEVVHDELASKWRFVVPHSGKFPKKDSSKYRGDQVSVRVWEQSALARTAARRGDTEVRQGLQS